MEELTEDPTRMIRKGRLQDQGTDDDLSQATTPQQRMDMMWQLVVNWYALNGEQIDESQFQRHVGCLVRGKR
jgi:hypothetical protein